MAEFKFELSYTPYPAGSPTTTEVEEPNGFVDFFSVLERDFSFMIGLGIALFIMAYGLNGKGRINRFEGGLLLTAYISYLVVLYYTAIA